MKTQTDDLRIKNYTRLISPREMKAEIPVSDAACRTVVAGREAIERILRKEDARLLVVTGPCSIHDDAGGFRLCRTPEGVAAEGAGCYVHRDAGLL